MCVCVCVCCKLLEYIVFSHTHQHMDTHTTYSRPVSIDLGNDIHVSSSYSHDLASYFDQKITVDVAILDLFADDCRLH